MKSLILATFFAIMALGMTLISCTSSVRQTDPFYLPAPDSIEMRKVQASIKDFVPQEWTADPDMIKELSTDDPETSETRWSHDHRYYYTTVPRDGWYNFSYDFPVPEKFDTQALVSPVNSVLKSLSDLHRSQLSDPLAKFVRKAIDVANDNKDSNFTYLPPLAILWYAVDPIRHYSLYGKLSPKIAEDIDSFLIIENVAWKYYGSYCNLLLFNVKADKLVSCVVLGSLKSKIYRLKKGLFVAQYDVSVPKTMFPKDRRKELDSLGLRKNKILYYIVRINEEGFVTW